MSLGGSYWRGVDLGCLVRSQCIAVETTGTANIITVGAPAQITAAVARKKDTAGRI